MKETTEKPVEETLIDGIPAIDYLKARELKRIQDLVQDLYSLNPACLNWKFNKLDAEVRFDAKLEESYDIEGKLRILNAISHYDEMKKHADIQAYEETCKKYNITEEHLKNIIIMRDISRNENNIRNAWEV